MLSEYACNSEKGTELSISKDIERLYSEQRINNPQNFFFIEERSYNFENPLVLSANELKKAYLQIKADPRPEERSNDLFYLFNSDQRYESQRCQFPALAEKRKYDLRPYLNITHACYKKYETNSCDDKEYINMSPDKASWAKINAIDLCLSFSKSISCRKEYESNLRNNTLGEMIRRYQDRFEKERYGPLFKLRPVHNKYSCDHIGEQIVMNLNVFGPAFDREYLRALLDAVEATWKNDNFMLKLKIVDKNSANVIQIMPTMKAISFVPDNDNRAVFLSSAQDLQTTKRVLAHEFGHVLGFPDCYIEFFDDIKKELVYYEISKNYTNIMCSLKNGVRVPEDYFVQLEQNSCIFN